MSTIKKDNWKHYTKGMGVIVSIPGDEHDGIQSKRPGIVLNAHPNYITVQLLSTQPSNHDLGSFFLNKKTQFVRPIYLKNILISQVKKLWFDNERNLIKLNDSNKLMQIIESNPYKATAITLALDEFLQLSNDIDKINKYHDIAQELLESNKSLQQTNDILKAKIETLNLTNLKLTNQVNELLNCNQTLQAKNFKLKNAKDTNKNMWKEVTNIKPPNNNDNEK